MESNMKIGIKFVFQLFSKTSTNNIRKINMALATGFLKEMHGVLGDCAIMHRGNKVFVKCRPNKSKKPPTEMALAKKASFGLAGKIAGNISSIEEIKHFWKGNPEKNQTGYNRMFQANHCQFNLEDFSGKVVLSDGYGLEVVNPSIEIEEAGLLINCDSFESVDVKKREAAKYVRAAGIIILKSPTVTGCAEYELMQFQTKDCRIEKGEKFSAEVKYLGGDGVKFQTFAIKKAFAVLISVDSEMNLTDISKTIESEVVLENIPAEIENDIAMVGE